MVSIKNLSVRPSTLVLAAMLTALPTPGFAQVQDSSSDASPASIEPETATTGTNSGLQDIVVTARRRAENLQDTPVSVTAFSGDALIKAGVQTATDIAFVTPGLQFGSGDAQRSELYLRGIGSNRWDTGSEPSVATFIDEVYQPRIAQQLVDLLDINRIEVLKGPQGTLYGRNTVGGAISVYTPKPTDTLTVKGHVEVGNKDLYAAQSTISGPLANGVLASLAMGYRERDGFMTDTISGRNNGNKQFAGRGKLLFKLTDTLQLEIRGALFSGLQEANIFYAEPTTPVFLLNPVKVPNPVAPTSRYNVQLTSPGEVRTEYRNVSAQLNWNNDDIALTSISVDCC